MVSLSGKLISNKICGTMKLTHTNIPKQPGEHLVFSNSFVCACASIVEERSFVKLKYCSHVNLLQC